MLKYPGMLVPFEFLERLYEHEKHKGMRRCHKLTESHYQPTNFERMNVEKAAQALSRTVAMVLNHYRNLPETHENFKGNNLQTIESLGKHTNDF